MIVAIVELVLSCLAEWKYDKKFILIRIHQNILNLLTLVQEHSVEAEELTSEALVFMADSDNQFEKVI